ncbi:hypothetical protein PVAP13_2NG595340 [Panicum virgatum]|uniref:Uncharacterized protein n=1 Tax=Panicum virgatum TaxID=38727 RepID=A0A8T0VUC4_PANVG|nr:hypothetical protein PVAP13_2NG595340 [Panicum virgatum]
MEKKSKKRRDLPALAQIREMRSGSIVQVIIIASLGVIMLSAVLGSVCSCPELPALTEIPSTHPAPPPKPGQGSSNIHRGIIIPVNR